MLIYFKKGGIPIKKAKYNENVNIDLNRFREGKYNKYSFHKPVKLFTNDIKVALFAVPTALAVGIMLSPSELSTGLYVISGCALAYATINLYCHKKQKEKRLIIK